MARRICCAIAMVLAVEAPLSVAEEVAERGEAHEESLESFSLRLTEGGETAEFEVYVDGDLAVIEGDIILGAADEVALLKGLDGVELQALPTDAIGGQRGGALGTRALAIHAIWAGRPTRWTNGIVYYDVTPSFPQPQRVDQAIAHWESHTPIRFKKFKSKTSTPSYVQFVGSVKGANGRCQSSVGMIGGRQLITADDWCSIGNIIHEIGHAAGLGHEHMRSDRDKFIDIDWSNVKSSMAGNFKFNSKYAPIGNYDYLSIMHYGEFHFAVDGKKPTIAPKQKVSGKIGQRNGLSEGDRAAIAELYGAATPR